MPPNLMLSQYTNGIGELSVYLSLADGLNLERLKKGSNSKS